MRTLDDALTRTPRGRLLLALLLVASLLALGIAMWVWIVAHVTRALDLERHGIRVTATVLADGPDPKQSVEQLSFPLPDGSTATVWTGDVTSRQPPGTTLTAIYLPGRPATVEGADYVGWWWVGAVVMPVFGTAFAAAGLWLLWALVSRVREGRQCRRGRFSRSRAAPS